MNYPMVERELKTLSEDLGQLSQTVRGPEPPQAKEGKAPPPRMVIPVGEVRKQLEYCLAKLKAVVDLTKENRAGTSPLG